AEDVVACLFNRSTIPPCWQRSMSRFGASGGCHVFLPPLSQHGFIHVWGRSGRAVRVEAKPMPQATPVVFVVDDDISVRESLEALIASVGWQPEVCASAQEFLSRPRARGPSCLILDVNLPDLNGLDLQRRVVADRTDMPIIFITGYGDVPMTVRAMKSGAV